MTNTVTPGRWAAPRRRPEPRGRCSPLAARAIGAAAERLGAPWPFADAPGWAYGGDDPAPWIDVATFEASVERMVVRSGDPSFGLHVGEAMPSAALDAFGLLPSVAASLGDVLSMIVEFRRAVSDVAHVSLCGDDVGPELRLELGRSSGAARRFVSECVFAALAPVVRALAGPEAARSRWSFEHREPGDRAAYQRILPGSIAFGQPHTAFVTTWEAARRTHALHSAALVAELRARAAELVPGTASAVSFADGVREYLGRLPPSARPTVRSVAAHFGIGPRALVARLSSEGASVADLVQASRGSVALDALRDPLRPIKDVAFELGFSAPSSFNRAFKRWTGLTPREARGLS